MKQIMVVDDDRDILALVDLILKGSDVKTIISDQPSQVIDDVRNNQPDTLLMDISMPPYDGRDICKSLKAIYKDDLFIILFSANKITSTSLRDSEADGFLQKPFDIEDLLKAVLVKVDK